MFPLAKIAVDLDDTLYDFGSVAKDALFSLAHKRGDKSLFRGMYSPVTQWRHPNDYAPDTWTEAIKLSHKPEVIMAQYPFPGAAATLSALSNKGHKIMYISNRDEKTWGATRSWLEFNKFPIPASRTTFGPVELICTMEDKLPLMEDCRYLIDDRPRTLVLFTRDYKWHRSHGSPEERVAFGRQTPYNENLTDVPNIYLAPSWSGIGYYLVREGLLDIQPFEAIGSVI